MRTLNITIILFVGFVLRNALIRCVTTMNGDNDLIHIECGFTRFPNLCVDALKEAGAGQGQLDIILILVNKTIQESKILHSKHFAKSMDQFGDINVLPFIEITEQCEKLLGMAVKQLNQAMEALKAPVQKLNKEDIQTWLSAALSFQQVCKDIIQSQSHPYKKPISTHIDYLAHLVSNPLALVNKMNKSKTKRRVFSSHGQEEEEEETPMFPKWVSAKDRKVLEKYSIELADVTVAQDGTGHHKRISEAIEAAPRGRSYVIHVKKGVYKEKINTSKEGLILIGDGKYASVIVGHDSVRRGVSLISTPTVSISGNRFMARDIGFVNSAGLEGEQAIALAIASDQAILYRCSIVGHQDTLFAVAFRQFYRECHIYGTVDFIFGYAAANFQKCHLLLRRPRAENVILAHGRTDPAQNTGFVVQRCTVKASSELYPVRHLYKSYLGRPWKEYSRSVVMRSLVDDLIQPKGWVEWPGMKRSVLGTLYFAEFANSGKGSCTSDRVRWPGFHVIKAKDATKFTVASFIAGTSWITSTGVAFRAGI